MAASSLGVPGGQSAIRQRAPPQPVRMHTLVDPCDRLTRGLLLTLVTLLVAALTMLRDNNINKSDAWRRTLSHWTCPTDPSDSDAPCDPCSKDWSGNWEFIHCRGTDAGPNGYGEYSAGNFDGYVTNVHITDQHLEGSPPRDFCWLDHLRELDLDGSSFTGPLPDWIITCLPHLQELDLSYNRLSGTIPAAISTKTDLQELKVEFNNFVGTIPKELADMPKLRVLRLEYNYMSGSVPQEFRKLSATLGQVELAHNDFSGDLMGLAEAQPVLVTTSDNPKLCGMVPAGIRYAKGFNPANTRLGYPCDE